MPAPIAQPNAAERLFANHGELLAEHGAKIEGLEKAEERTNQAVSEVAKSVDSLKFWLIGTLAASCGALFLLLAQLMGGKHS